MGYVIFYNPGYFISNPIDIFKIWEGGMSFHGALIGIVLGTYLFSIKKNLSTLFLLDIIACVSPIGIFLGRIANFINGELVGKISNVPWSVIFPSIDMMPRHPSQLYEALLEGALLFILINYFALKKKLLFRVGFISGFFLIFYSLFRIFAEIFREPDLHVGYLFNYFSLGTLLSFITLIVGLIIVFNIKKNEQNN